MLQASKGHFSWYEEQKVVWYVSRSSFKNNITWCQKQKPRSLDWAAIGQYIPFWNYARKLGLRGRNAWVPLKPVILDQYGRVTAALKALWKTKMIGYNSFRCDGHVMNSARYSSIQSIETLTWCIISRKFYKPQ